MKLKVFLFKYMHPSGMLSYNDRKMNAVGQETPKWADTDLRRCL